MRIGYYPGCSLLGSSKEFDESVRALCQALDIELAEVPDWNCCGASSAHVLDHRLAMALPARILAQARAAGLEEILAPCAACYNRLASAARALAADPLLAGDMEQVIGMPLGAQVKVVNILEVLDRRRDRLAERAVRPFRHKLACYYGCLLVRPPRVVAFDRPEDPQCMDRMVASVGATAVDWNFKTECCGAAFSVARTGSVARLSGRILQDAVKRGAEAIVVACPMCHSNLDMRRPEINRALGTEHTVPVLFVTQVLGLALGIEPRALGLQRHMVPFNLSAPANV
jgi:heterodisulfide reductase subunit B